ncbi:hypothetical protein [Pleurocapsa sp. FMAR1]|uniref:hypothetical protein n=1 Tax=Pleurocapsa sp. FMAR1 TaxID=3040204 RepID=UPI0029C6C2B9|nr:hypothetical protein [Pleurocapsa sp. FMAR1]
MFLFSNVRARNKIKIKIYGFDSKSIILANGLFIIGLQQFQLNILAALAIAAGGLVIAIQFLIIESIQKHYCININKKFIRVRRSLLAVNDFATQTQI